MEITHVIGPSLQYWVGTEFRTSYVLVAHSEQFEAAVDMAEFATTASLPRSVILADTGIPEFIDACERAPKFVRKTLEFAAPTRFQIRRLGNGNVRMDYEAEPCGDGGPLVLRQTWNPNTDEITNDARAAAKIAYHDFLGMWKALQEFYAQIALSVASA